MVKGITKQVIVVHTPEPELFEQAIFILKEDAVQEGITEEMLLREAKKAVRQGSGFLLRFSGLFWALGGAAFTGLLWFLSNAL